MQPLHFLEQFQGAKARGWSVMPPADSPRGGGPREPAMVEEDAGQRNQHAKRTVVAAASGKAGLPDCRQGPAADAEMEAWRSPLQPVSQPFPARAGAMCARARARVQALFCVQSCAHPLPCALFAGAEGPAPTRFVVAKQVQLPFTSDNVFQWLLAPHDVNAFFSEVSRCLPVVRYARGWCIICRLCVLHACAHHVSLYMHIST